MLKTRIHELEQLCLEIDKLVKNYGYSFVEEITLKSNIYMSKIENNKFTTISYKRHTRLN